MLTEWQKRNTLHNAAIGKASENRDEKDEAANLTRLAAIDARILAIDKRLAAEFPDYAALASPAPSTLVEVQSQLRPDEALILFLDTQEWKPMPEETFIWVVTKTDLRWMRSEFGTAGLKREVAALRCGLDAESWDGDGANKCAEFVGIPLDQEPHANDELPFDLSRAHGLYKTLFGGAEDIISGKSLFIVPSGPLTQLPFQVLVTKLQ